LAFGRSNIATATADPQYVTIGNAGRRPMIAKLSMPDGAWSSYELAYIIGNPMSSAMGDDGHNASAVVVDADGYVHVSGNMHNISMRYSLGRRPRRDRCSRVASGGELTEYLGGLIGSTMQFDSWLNPAEFRAAQARIARTYGITPP
jgi:hypothetical protein